MIVTRFLNQEVLGSRIEAENYILQENETDILCTETFVKPMFDGQKYYEGASEEDLKPKVPDSVKSIAFMSALELIGITNTMVLQFIETLPPPMNIFVKHSFERATFFERNSPFIPMVGQAFNKTDAELDNVFITARNIEIQLGL